MDINIKNVSIIIRFYEKSKKIFRDLHVYFPILLFSLLFLLSVNIYINLVILILTAYVTRVLWVFSINKYNVYIIVKELLEKEITNNFK
jgi:hypothetical protein